MTQTVRTVKKSEAGDPYPIQYSSFACLSACLPSSDLSEGTNSWVTGWGALEENSWSPAILQQAKIPLISKQTCSCVYEHWGTSRV